MTNNEANLKFPARSVSVIEELTKEHDPYAVRVAVYNEVGNVYAGSKVTQTMYNKIKTNLGV